MPRPLTPLPDPTLATIQFLRTIGQLTALTAAVKIVSELPNNPDYTTPYVIVQHAGGNGIWPAFDDAAMQIDVVGGTKVLCGQVTGMVRAAVWAIANDIVAAGVLASGADEMAPAWMPDAIMNPPTPRYTARYRILLHS